MAEPRRYEEDQRRCVAMPLGGIGTGNVSITGTGALRQWEILNVGNHLGFLPQSFFALRASALEPPRSWRRILQAPPIASPPEPAPLVTDHIDPSRTYAREFAWPFVRSTRFEAAYPFARVEYVEDWPLDVRLEAFTPFVPLDDAASSFPLASFRFTIRNRFSVAVTGWLFGSLQNVVGWDGVTPIRDERCALLGGNVNTVAELDGGTAVVMANPELAKDDPGAGSMALWSDRPAAALAQFDDADAALAFLDTLKLQTPVVLEDWSDTAVARSLAALRPLVRTPVRPSEPGRTWAGGLAAPFHLEPNEATEIELVVAWHFPNRAIGTDQFGWEADLPAEPILIGNHYATVFSEARDVVHRYADDRASLRARSAQWSDSLLDSTLPEIVVDVLSAQPSLVRSPTVFRDADGNVFGYEGVLGESTLNWNANAGGSCPMNCTHVWNYEQALAQLFPSLERRMRAIDWEILQAPDGAIPHRVLLPLDRPQLHGRDIGGPTHAALDGMLGTVLKTYREAQAGGGTDWLARYLPNMRRLMDYVRARWDANGDGVLTGEQPVTHDISLHGANMYVGGLWLAALRAMEATFSHLGHRDEAADYRLLFETASVAYDELLWNGRYYTQRSTDDVFDFGDGCLADQLLGQWWAHRLRLGHLLPRDHVRVALESIVTNNLRHGFRDFEHGYRVFADGDDSGLLICTWPNGGRPEVPIRYADEVWTGVEYQVAAHCLYEDMPEQATAVLEALRARYDGTRRNPFNEIECGDHYARAMAGWSVLDAMTACHFDALTGHLHLGGRVGRHPLLAGSAWLDVHNSDAATTLTCRGGTISIRSISFGTAGSSADILPLSLSSGESVALDYVPS